MTEANRSAARDVCEPAVRECSRCGYHYKPVEMRVLERPTRYLCRDRVRCNRNIARREADRAALK